MLGSASIWQGVNKMQIGQTQIKDRKVSCICMLSQHENTDFKE